MRSFAEFQGPIREAIHHLKYRHDIGLGDALALHMIEYFTHLNWEVDMVLPVPLSRERLEARGYNQAALVAHPFALALGLEYLPKEVERTRDTPSQVGLTSEQRRANVAGAFKARSERVAGKKVLVIDDVTTTGSTISACAEGLLNAGVHCVYGLTVARAVLHRN